MEYKDRINAKKEQITKQVRWSYGATTIKLKIANQINLPNY